MAKPTPSWSTTRVYASWRKLDGTTRAGTYKITIPARVVNVADDVIIPAGVFAQGPLITVDGVPSLDVDVPSNNDPDNSPAGWKVTVEVTFTDAKAETYVIDTPEGGEINLRTVVLTTTVPTQQALMLRGVPGGLATLDAQGDVVNAAGQKVTGGTDQGAITAVQTALAAKADAAAMTTALAGKASTADLAAKADAAAMTTALAGKASTADLAAKADAAATATALAGKADATATTAALAGKAGSSDPSLHFLGYGPTPPDPTGMPDGRVWLLTAAEG